MLTLIRSPIPDILQAKDSLPEEVARLLEQVVERPERFAWVVPTGRRKRALVKDWLAISRSTSEPRPLGSGSAAPLANARGSDSFVLPLPHGRGSDPADERFDSSSGRAAILPRFFTLESFVGEALEYGLRQKPRISGPERVLWLAGVWHEVTGRAAGPGVIHQFDRYIRDCQACGVKPSPTSRDPFDRLVNSYVSKLDEDGRLDRMAAVAALVEEISDPEGWPNRMFLRRFEAVLIDGFHRFEPVELDLIAALSKVRDVVLWLVGIPGTSSWETVKKATDFLEEKVGIQSQDWKPDALPSQFAELGHRLFRSEAVALLARRAMVETPPGLFKLEVDSPMEEVEETARQIKADYLESQKTDRPLRLSDVAVVIPGPAYDPLIREVFPRAGLEFNLAGRALLVSTSRPARVLLAAINLIQGRWRYDLLLDFLNQPLVKRKLDDAYRLDDLFEHRPRARQRMDYEVWSRSWKKQLERLNKNIEGWRSGRLDLPERTTLSREEYVAKQTNMARSLERLIASIQTILGPIMALERTFENPSPEKPLRDLIQVMNELLSLLEVDRWLTPPPYPNGSLGTRSGSAVLRTAAKPSGIPEGPVLWVEYEKDQNAYLKLLNILESLQHVPASRLPKRAGEPGGVSPRSPDVLTALRLALDGETYQIKTDDDAGVQVFELREIRGLRFRHVYVLGLVNGQIPALPEEGTLVSRRLQNPLLKAQLEQKETEVQFLFSQVFETAQEKLILSRTTLEGDRPTLPSPFFTAVDELVEWNELRPHGLVTGIAQTACELGRAFRCNGVARPESSKGVARGVSTPFEDSERATRPLYAGRASLSSLWPKVLEESAVELEPILTRLHIWHQRPVGAELAVDWPEMLQALFPDDYQFSPSQLETYAACPFRFFGSRVLHLEEREADPTRLHYGSLVHRVLQRVYAEKRKKNGTPPDGPLAPVGREDREQFIQAFRAEAALLDDGMLPPDLQVMFVSPGGVIDLLLEILETLEGQPGDFGNLETELLLEKVEVGRDAAGRPVFLTGKIDRVDGKRSDPRMAIILDYKTGGSPPPSSLKVKVVDGRMLQLPLYAAALEIKRPDQHVVGAAYVHLNERAKSDPIGVREAIVTLGELGERLPGKKESESEIWNTRAALDLALDFAGRIRAGRFPLTRFGNGTDEVECTAYCPLRHACRHPEGYASTNWR